MAGDSRWQVRWKPTRESPGRSQTFTSAAVSRGKSQARRDAERLKAYVELHGNACTAEDALVALGYLDVIASSQEPLTVSEWAERWVATRTGIAPRTQHAYQVTLERHVLPKLGDLQLARLSRSDVEAWVANLQPTMAPKTLVNAHGVLSSMLEAATRETPPLRPDNPARGIRLRRGGITDAEMCFLTHAEWALLYGCLERVSTAGREVDSTIGQLEKRPRIHDLRRTHAAWLIAAGRPLPSIQRRLGHESITTTVDTYGHLMVEVDTGDIAALSEALSFNARTEPQQELTGTD